MMLPVDLIARGTGKPLANVTLHWPLVYGALETRQAGQTLSQIGAAATIAVETPGFAPLSELGKPAYFDKYEPETAIGKRLGNTAAGDGARYKGRGLIQLTGRANYHKASLALGLDLEGHPDTANEPAVAAQVFAWYWAAKDLPAWCLKRNWAEVRRRVNGGYHGWPVFERAVKALLAEAEA